MINGFTDFNLTKLDVLTGLDEIRMGVDYVFTDEGGVKRTIGMPSSLEVRGSGYRCSCMVFFSVTDALCPNRSIQKSKWSTRQCRDGRKTFPK